MSRAQVPAVPVGVGTEMEFEPWLNGLKNTVNNGQNASLQVIGTAWSGATNYDTNDLTTDGPNDYRALQPSLNKQPSANPTFWKSLGATVVPATTTTQGIVTLQGAAPASGEDSQAARAITAQNQILFFVTTDATLNLRATSTQTTFGTAQTVNNSDNAATRKTKYAAVLGVADSILTVYPPPPNRYVVSGPVSPGNYDIGGGAGGNAAYLLGGGTTRWLRGLDGLWVISDMLFGDASTGATIYATSATSDPTGAWNNGVSVAAGSASFGGVLAKIGIGGISGATNFSGFNFPKFYAEGAPANFYSAPVQEGVIADRAASVANVKQNRGLLDKVLRMVESLVAAGASAVTSVAGRTGAVTLSSGDIGDFGEAAQDAAGSLFADSADLDVTYDDVGNAETIALQPTTVTAGIYSNLTGTVDAKGRLTAAANGNYMAVPVSGAVNTTGTAQQVANSNLEFTGALTAAITYTVPAVPRAWYFRNSTTGGFAVTVKTPSGTGVAVAAGATAHLDCDGTNVVAFVGGGGASNSNPTITQTAHGFTQNQLVRRSGTIYVLGLGDTGTNAETVGYVQSVTDANNFVLGLPGTIGTGFTGLTVGNVRFLDTATAGATTDTDPATVSTNGGKIRKVVFIPLSATTALFVYDPGSVISFAGQSIQGYSNVNGQDFKTYQIQELLTIAAAATTASTISIPAGATVRSVTLRVVTAIPTATTFGIGINGAATRYGTALSVAAGTTNVSGGTANPSTYAAATNLLITPNATPASATGQVRIVVYYDLATAPTS